VPAVLILAFLLSKPSLTFPAFGLGYTLSGPLEWLWRRRTGRALEPFREADDSPDEESS